MTDKKEAEVKWEDWQKKRVFVREVAGKYEEIFKTLQDQPRVYKGKDRKFKGGPTEFNKHMVSPKDTITQAMHCHIVVLAPGQYGQNHGHMNSAVMYVLEGKGHDIHDGVRYEWEAGDAVLVGNARVHQHFNDSKTHPARILVIKPKPLVMFLDLFHQKTVSYPPEKPLPGFENFRPAD